MLPPRTWSGGEGQGDTLHSHIYCSSIPDHVLCPSLKETSFKSSYWPSGEERRAKCVLMKLLFFTPFLWCCTGNLGSCLLLLHLETLWSTPLCLHGNRRWYRGGSHAWPPGLSAPPFTMQRTARHLVVIYLLVGISRSYHRKEAVAWVCQCFIFFISPAPPPPFSVSPLQASCCSGAREWRSSGRERERGSAVSPH